MSGLQSALCQAAADGALDECRRLLSEGADANATSKFGIGALALACAGSHVDCARALLAASADVNMAAGNRSTVLSFACDAGLVDVCQLLLELSADVLLVSGSERRTALHNSSRNRRSTRCAPLILAAAGDAPEFVNLSDSLGATALGLACKNGHADVVGSLLKAGADPSLRWGALDALALARDSGNPACTRLVQGHLEGRPTS